MQQKGKLDALYNMILFGSEELKNYNERLDKEINERQFLNLYLKTIKQTISADLTGKKTVFNQKKISDFQNRRKPYRSQRRHFLIYKMLGNSWKTGFNLYLIFLTSGVWR